MKIKNLKMYEGCLIVVDMVNGFVEEGVLHDKEIKKIVKRQIELIKEAKQAGKLIVFIKDTHTKNSTEFERFGNTEHCMKNSNESKLIKELQEYENNCLKKIINKKAGIMDEEKLKQYLFKKGYRGEF